MHSLVWLGEIVSEKTALNAAEIDVIRGVDSAKGLR